MASALNYEYNFILYRETLLFGAISNDILRRAMGVSKYRKTRLFLVECSEEFSDHAKNYTAAYDLEILLVHSLHEIKYMVLKNRINNQIIVTHTWPTTLFPVSKTFEHENLLLIDDVAPLIDRWQGGNPDRKSFDYALTLRPVRKIITFRYRRSIKRAKVYVAISDYELKFMKIYYKIIPDAVIYCPVDERFFAYTETERISLMVFGNPNQNAIKFVTNSLGPNIIKEIILVNSKLNLSGSFPSDIKIAYISDYTFQEIRDMYGKTLLSITEESKGSFELIPIESIMSGVPIISPIVPSLQILTNRINSSSSREKERIYPYFDYLKLMDDCERGRALEEFARWFSDVSGQREFFSIMCNKLFSIDAVAKDFIAKVEQHFSYVSEK